MNCCGKGLESSFEVGNFEYNQRMIKWGWKCPVEKMGQVGNIKHHTNKTLEASLLFFCSWHPYPNVHYGQFYGMFPILKSSLTLL